MSDPFSERRLTLSRFSDGMCEQEAQHRLVVRVYGHPETWAPARQWPELVDDADWPDAIGTLWTATLVSRPTLPVGVLVFVGEGMEAGFESPAPDLEEGWVPSVWDYFWI